jgi:pimeloyl-ACP methyl ester carboxylesterase
MDDSQRTIELGDGARMAVTDLGHRVPLLFIHGFPLDHSIWEPQVEAFRSRRRVLAPDLVGFGASSGAVRSSLDDHADDLAALLDVLGVRRVVAIGLSMGGYVALSLWRRHRQRVAAMVLACSRAGPDVEANRAARYQMAIAVENQGVPAIADALLPRLLGPSASAELRDKVQQMMYAQPAEGVIAALKAMAARPNSRNDLGSIEVPALVVTGEQDEVIPVASSVAMADAIPDSQLVVVPGVGHLVNFEDPAAFNAALRAFLDRVDRT